MTDAALTTDAEEGALVDALAQTAFVVTAVLARIAADHDVSLTQMRVLGAMRGRRPRMAQLADLVGLDKTTMSGLIRRAEQRGLVERCRNAADARVVDVVMTPAGTDLTERGHADLRRALTSVTERLSDADRRTLRRLLEALLDAGPSEPHNAERLGGG